LEIIQDPSLILSRIFKYEIGMQALYFGQFLQSATPAGVSEEFFRVSCGGFVFSPWAVLQPFDCEQRRGCFLRRDFSGRKASPWLPEFAARAQFYLLCSH